MLTQADVGKSFTVRIAIDMSEPTFITEWITSKAATPSAFGHIRVRIRKFAPGDDKWDWSGSVVLTSTFRDTVSAIGKWQPSGIGDKEHGGYGPSLDESYGGPSSCPEKTLAWGYYVSFSRANVLVGIATSGCKGVLNPAYTAGFARLIDQRIKAIAHSVT